MSSPDNGFSIKDELTWIAGSVVLNDNPPLQLKYWRKRFGVKQADLAKKMAITPSVLSDYEKGRRPSPGANFIKRYLQALYELGRANNNNNNGGSGSNKMQQQEHALEPMAPDAVHINPQ